MDFPYVAMNDYEAGKMATRHLLRRGHRKIFGIFKSDDVQGHFRYSGYVNQMRDADTAFEDSWVLWYTTEDVDSLFAPKDDERLLSRIGDSTGVVCYNDEIACKLLEVFAAFARGNGLAFLTLEVRASNAAAIALYTKLGFVQAGRRKNYYEHPREDAWIMTRSFSPSGAPDGEDGTMEKEE